MKLLNKHHEKGIVSYAFIDYNTATAAVEAMKELDGNMAFGGNGRPLR